jgi:hypothetical protein
MKNKKSVLLIIALLVIAVYLIISYPIQKHFAEKHLNEYISLQGTSNENIESQRIYKDNKIGGYAFDIKYKDDPNHRYEYHYSFKRKEMICIVYNLSNSSVETGKYRSINQ